MVNAPHSDYYVCLNRNSNCIVDIDSQSPNFPFVFGYYDLIGSMTRTSNYDYVHHNDYSVVFHQKYTFPHKKNIIDLVHRMMTLETNGSLICISSEQSDSKFISMLVMVMMIIINSTRSVYRQMHYLMNIPLRRVTFPGVRYDRLYRM